MKGYRVGPAETFWPLAVARLASVIFMLIVALIRRQPVLPKKEVALFVLLAGVLDAVGNAFFVLAAHTGRLDVASILSSLYPAATMLLAALILRERVRRIQGIGILVALVAIPLISTPSNFVLFGGSSSCVSHFQNSFPQDRTRVILAQFRSMIGSNRCDGCLRS